MWAEGSVRWTDIPHETNSSLLSLSLQPFLNILPRILQQLQTRLGRLPRPIHRIKHLFDPALPLLTARLVHAQRRRERLGETKLGQPFALLDLEPERGPLELPVPEHAHAGRVGECAVDGLV